MAPATDNQESARKAFLSHAHLDKSDYVLPLARELDKLGVSYWLDEAEIAWGERITTKINDGLARSEFVVVFLSDAFVGRNWTEAELGAALGRENAEGRALVLPIMIGDAPRLLLRYPLLRDKKYLTWDLGVSTIAGELLKLANRLSSTPRPSDPEQMPKAQRELSRAESDRYKDLGRAKVQLWGERLNREGRWDWDLLGHAIDHYVDAIRRDPDSQHPWTNLAYVLYLVGEGDRAYKCLERSFNLAGPGPNHPGNNYKQVKRAIDSDTYLSGGRVERPPVPSWFWEKHSRLPLE